MRKLHEQVARPSPHARTLAAARSFRSDASRGVLTAPEQNRPCARAEQLATTQLVDAELESEHRGWMGACVAAPDSSALLASFSIAPGKRWRVRHAGLAGGYLNGDRQGVLRRAAMPREEGLLEWLNGRRVGRSVVAGTERWSWFTPTPAGLFRQQRELGPSEVERWLHLPSWFRRQHDVFSPLGQPAARWDAGERRRE